MCFSASAAPEPLSAHPQHVVFFIHGLMADHLTFEGFEKSIQEDFGNKVITSNLTYPTGPADCNFEGNDWIHPLHFAKIINSKIIDFYFNNDLDLNTPYSLIVHSQGGLTAMVYLNTCMQLEDGTQRPWCPYMDGVHQYAKLSRYKNSTQFKSEQFQEILANYIENHGENGKISNAEEKELFYDNYPKCKQFRDHAIRLTSDAPAKRDYLQGHPSVPNVENLISLGSPFWGSATANRGNSMKALLDSNLVDNMAPLAQLNRLAIGSRGTSWQRMLLLNRNATPEKNWNSETRWTSPYPESLKVYNLAGDLWEGTGLFSTTMIGSTVLFKLSRFESDIIVGAPSARLDTIYNIENYDSEGHPFKGVTDITENYFATRLPHIPLLGLYGMAQVTLEERMEHPSYLIAKRVLENSLNSSEKPILTDDEMDLHLAKSVENFNSEIKLISPHGYHRKFSIPRQRIEITPDNPDVFDDLQVTNTLYAVGHGPNNDAMKIKHHYFQTYFHIGKFSDEHSFIPFKQHAYENSMPLEAQEDYNLNYEIKVHGFERKKLSNYVAPSYSSYTEGYLTPFHPIQNNQRNGLSDQLNRTVGVYRNIDKDTAHIIKLNEDMSLQMSEKSIDQMTDFEFSQLQLSPGDMGRCYVGTMGISTPDRFRHQVIINEALTFEGGDIARDENGDPIKKTVAKMKMIVPDYWAINSSTGQPRKQYEDLTGNQLWEKYAPNKNYVYKNFMDLTPDKDDFDIIGFGSAVEVLGRYSIGKIEEKSQTGRRCSNQEYLYALEGKPWADTTHCLDPDNNPSIDRYLITSPEIRQADGVEVPNILPFIEYSREQIEANSTLSFLEEKDGRILGTRWVNVVDIDIFENGYPTLAPGGYTGYHRGNHCIINRPHSLSDYYSTRTVYKNYFYRFE